MIAFALAVLLLFITPGPGVLSTAGVGSGFGRAAGLRYIGGLMLGHNLVGLLVISGLAASVLALPGLRPLLSLLSAGWLLWLAWRIARGGARIGFVRSARAPGAVDALALQLVNPKAYVVSTALYTGFAFWPAHYWAEVAIKLLINNAIWLPVHLLWLWAGLALQRLALSASAQRRINAAMALSLVAVAALALLV